MKINLESLTQCYMLPYLYYSTLAVLPRVTSQVHVIRSVKFTFLF